MSFHIVESHGGVASRDDGDLVRVMKVFHSGSGSSGEMHGAGEFVVEVGMDRADDLFGTLDFDFPLY
jgi:hypothetical protein